MNDNGDGLNKEIAQEIKVFSIELDKTPWLMDGDLKIGSVVKVRPLIHDNEYYGIYLGMVVNNIRYHISEFKELTIQKEYEVLIFIPDLKITILGNEFFDVYKNLIAS